MKPIMTLDDIERGLGALLAADSRLAAVAAVAGPVPLRRFEPGFEGLARIIVGQQISTHAAAAIWGRFHALLEGEVIADRLGHHADEDLRGVGLSAGKVRTLRAIAVSCVTDGLDLNALAAWEAGEAIARLRLISGVGPWTAEIFLMFCAGHPDIWPGGDLALQNALQDAFGLAERPSDKQTRAMAEEWAPWRSVAARLFWAFYGQRREGATFEPVAR
jgi:DNA-3-methyladenine glycosylase II